MSKVIMNATGGNKVKINVGLGTNVKIKADEVTSLGVEQNSSGGLISQHAKKTLNQIGNKMTAEDGGEIVNQSEDDLNQVGNEMKVGHAGKIKNIAGKATEVGLLLLVLGTLAYVLGIADSVTGLLSRF